MNSKSEDIKSVLAKAVRHVVDNEKGKKSSMTKIGTVKKTITTVLIEPFTR